MSKVFEIGLPKTGTTHRTNYTGSVPIHTKKRQLAQNQLASIESIFLF